MSSIAQTAAALIFSAMLAGTWAAAYAGGSHSSDDDGHDNPSAMIESMREMHRSHMHGHDFEVMEEMRPEQICSGRISSITSKS